MNYDIKEVFGDINNIFINKLEIAKKAITDDIEIELFNDCIETYKRAYRLVEINRILDGIVLTRNSFELIMMLFGIKTNIYVRKEYCREDSHKRYLKRKNENKNEDDYLSQKYLRRIILEKYNNIEENYDKIYSALSKYAHPTIHRNIIRFFERENVNISLFYLNIIMFLPILFLELLYEENIIDEEDFQDIAVFKYIIEKLTVIYLCNNYIDKDKLKEANKYAYLDVNKEYWAKTQDEVKRELEEIERDSKKGQEECKELIKKVLTKLEYYTIAEKIKGLEMIKVVAALIENNGKVLIAKRSTGTASVMGKWEFPGGKVENGETEQEAIEREILEEFEVVIKADKFLVNNVCEYPDRIIDLNLYHCEYLEGKFKLHDHSEYEWVEPKALLNYDLAPADIPLSEYVRDHINYKKNKKEK